MSNVVLSGGENQDGRYSEKIGGLVAIEERTEIARVVPGRNRMIGKVKQNAERGDRDDTGSEKLQLKTGHAQFQFLSRDAVKPAQTGDKTGETTSGQPGRRGYRSEQCDSEIVRECW